MTSTQLVSSGVVLLTIVGIAYGGTFLLRVVTGGAPANDLQKSFFRAGHAHAAVLVILGLVVQLLVAQAPDLPSWSAQLSSCVLYAAVLMPAGFFLSVLGEDPQAPTRLRYLIWAGAVSLTVGVAAAGLGLIVAGSR